MYLHTFIRVTFPGKTGSDVLILAASLRDYGGAQTNAPLRILITENTRHLSTKDIERLAALTTTIVPYTIEEEVHKYPFRRKVQAASIAEDQLAESTEFLTRLDSDTHILNAPRGLSLAAGKVFVYHPEHHRLIGPV